MVKMFKMGKSFRSTFCVTFQLVEGVDVGVGWFGCPLFAGIEPLSFSYNQFAMVLALVSGDTNDKALGHRALKDQRIFTISIEPN